MTQMNTPAAFSVRSALARWWPSQAYPSFTSLQIHQVVVLACLSGGRIARSRLVAPDGLPAAFGAIPLHGGVGAAGAALDVIAVLAVHPDKPFGVAAAFAGEQVIDLGPLAPVLDAPDR